MAEDPALETQAPAPAPTPESDTTDAAKKMATEEKKEEEDESAPSESKTDQTTTTTTTTMGSDGQTGSSSLQPPSPPQPSQPPPPPQRSAPPEATSSSDVTKGTTASGTGGGDNGGNTPTTPSNGSNAKPRTPAAWAYEELKLDAEELERVALSGAIARVTAKGKVLDLALRLRRAGEALRDRIQAKEQAAAAKTEEAAAKQDGGTSAEAAEGASSTASTSPAAAAAGGERRSDNGVAGSTSSLSVPRKRKADDDAPGAASKSVAPSTTTSGAVSHKAAKVGSDASPAASANVVASSSTASSAAAVDSPPLLKPKDKWVQRCAPHTPEHCLDYERSNSCPHGSTCQKWHVYRVRSTGDDTADEGTKETSNPTATTKMTYEPYTRSDLEHAYETYRKTPLASSDYCEKIKSDGLDRPRYASGLICPLDKVHYYASGGPNGVRSDQGIWWYPTVKEARDALARVVIKAFMDRKLVPTTLQGSGVDPVAKRAASINRSSKSTGGPRRNTAAGTVINVGTNSSGNVVRRFRDPRMGLAMVSMAAANAKAVKGGGIAPQTRALSDPRLMGGNNKVPPPPPPPRRSPSSSRQRRPRRSDQHATSGAASALPQVHPFDWMENASVGGRCPYFNNTPPQPTCSFGTACRYAHVHYPKSVTSGRQPHPRALSHAYRINFGIGSALPAQSISYKEAVGFNGDVWYTAAVKCPKERTIYYAAGGLNGVVNEQNIFLYPTMDDAKLAAVGVVLDAFKARGFYGSWDKPKEDDEEMEEAEEENKDDEAGNGGGGTGAENNEGEDDDDERDMFGGDDDDDDEDDDDAKDMFGGEDGASPTRDASASEATSLPPSSSPASSSAGTKPTQSATTGDDGTDGDTAAGNEIPPKAPPAPDSFNKLHDAYRIHRKTPLAPSDFHMKRTDDADGTAWYTSTFICPVEQHAYHPSDGGTSEAAVRTSSDGTRWYRSVDDAREAVASVVLRGLRERGVVPPDDELKMATLGEGGTTTADTVGDPLPALRHKDFMVAAGKRHCREFNSSQGCKYGTKCKFPHVHRCDATAHGEDVPDEKALTYAYMTNFKLALSPTAYTMLSMESGTGRKWHTGALTCPEENTIYYAFKGRNGKANHQGTYWYPSEEDAKLAIAAVVLRAFEARGLYCSWKDPFNHSS